MSTSICRNCRGQIPAGASFCPLCKAPVGQAGSAKRGFNPLWLVVIGLGCLGLIALVGIVAAIMIPNFIDSLEKGRSKRTMADLRQLQTALVEHSIDAEPTGAFPNVSSVDELEGLINFEGPFPTTDAWTNPLVYQCWKKDPSFEGDCDTFRIASPGKDNAFDYDDLSAYETGTFLRTDYTQDLVISEEGFVRSPDRGGSNTP